MQVEDKEAYLLNLGLGWCGGRKSSSEHITCSSSLVKFWDFNLTLYEEAED